MASNDIELLKTDAKKTISSLIISSARGLTVKRLRHDYYETIGTDMPFRQLGFRSVEEYLHSLPDVCCLDGYGDFATVIPVVTEKNKHINDMIMKQKVTKPAGRFPVPKRRRGIYNTQNSAPAQRPPPKPVENFKFPTIPDSERKSLPPPPDYYYDLRKNKSKPQNGPQQQSFNHYNRNVNYNKENQQKSNYNYNSNATNHPLMNYSQTNNYNNQGNNNSTQRVHPLSDNPQNQINPRKMTPPLLPPGSKFETSASNNEFETPNATNYPRTNSYDNQNHINPRKITKIPEPCIRPGGIYDTSASNNEFESPNATNYPQTNNYNNQNQIKPRQITKMTPPSSKFEPSAASNNDFETPFSEVPQQFVNSGHVPDTQKGVELLNIYRRYESHEDEDFDDDDFFFEELNFTVDDDDFNYVSDNEADLTTSISNLVVREELPSPASCPTVEPPLVEEPHSSRVNKRVKDKLTLLITEHPDGIWCSKLLKLYEQRFRTKLNPLNFGFGSVIEMCDDLPDLFYCIRPNRTDWKVYDKSKPIPDIHSMREFSNYLSSLTVVEDAINTEPPLPANIMNSIPTIAYPGEVLHPDETIKRQWLTFDEKLGDYIELVISEVYDPSKFWIQLKSTNDDLGKLMDEMQLFYVNNANTYLVNEFNVRVGLVCAAVFMNEYHRAIVIKIFDDQTIKVFYCDYGTVSQVSLRKTCFLHRDFAELPMQAIRARLANIMPKEQNTMWPRAASNLMLSLVMEKDLVGYINAIDYEQEILDLIVTDTTKPDIDIHVNDVLVEEGFAVLGNEAALSCESNAMVPNVHLYPAFEELENAIYPCVSDVITMLKLGHTYETIFHGYFATSASSSQAHDYSNLQHSRCSTSFDEAYSNCVYIDNNIITEQFDQEQQENEESNIEIENDEITETQDISPVPSETKISDVESVKSESNATQTSESQIRAPPGFKNAPPGFENRPPTTTYQQPQESQFQKLMYPIQSLPIIQNLPFQNYSMLNTYPYSLLLTNPVLYNQLMFNQQSEAYLRTMQQVTWIEEMQKLQLLNQQQMHQVVNSFAQNVSAQNADVQPPVPNCDNNVRSDQRHELSDNDISVEKSADKSYTDLNTPNLNISDQSSNLVSRSSNFQITTDQKNDASSTLSNISEHICERFVLKLTLHDYTIHILKIENEFYVAFQEVITNLLKLNLPWKKWIKSVNITGNEIPNILVNIMNYKHLFAQVKRFNIPGINASNNLGCIVRLTLLTNVADIVAKFGNKRIVSDLKAGITHVMENTDLWKDVDSSD